MQFLLYSHIGISFCALFMAAETYILFDEKFLTLKFPVLILIFCATFIMYNFKVLLQYVTPIQFRDSDKSEWVESHRNIILIGSIVSAVCIGISSFFLNERQWYSLVLLGIVSIWYYIPLIKIPLIKIPFLKVVLISLVWNAVTVLIPMLSFSSIPENFLYYLIYKLIWILALAIVFDIKDIELDKKNGIYTLPVIVGVYKTKVTSILFLWIGLLFSLLVLSSLFFGIALATTILASFFILKIDQNTKDEYYLLSIDGVVLLQSLLNIFVVLSSSERGI